MIDANVALHLKSLRDAGFEWEAAFFERHIDGLNLLRQHALTDANLARAERDQWRNRCVEVRRKYNDFPAHRSTVKPREHYEALTYEYEGDGSTP